MLELLLLFSNMFLLGLDKVKYFWCDPCQPTIATVLIPSYLLEYFFIQVSCAHMLVSHHWLELL